MSRLDDIHSGTIEVYDRQARAWDKHRTQVFFEQAWLDRFSNHLPPGGRVLDVGCGAGRPVADYLLKCGYQVTGLDASSKMLEIAEPRFPEATWIKMDMRDMQLEQTFDGIVSWDGFFHLSQNEQRRTLLLFADHLSAEGTLLLTIGPESGEITGNVEGEEVYHSSLEPDEYIAILETVGFRTFDIKLEDENCGFHSILLAKREDNVPKRD